MKNPWNPPIRYIVAVILFILAIAALWYIRDIFKPLITAALFAYLLDPLVKFVMVRLKTRRKLAANIVFFSVLAVIVALLLTVVPALLDDAQSFFRDFNISLDQYQVILNQPFNVNGLPVYLGSVIPAIRSTFASNIIPRAEQALQIIETTSRGFLWFLLIIVTTYNLMTEWDKLREWLIGLAPNHYENDVRRLYMDIKAIWQGYLRGQIRLIFILVIIYAVAWFVIGLPGAIVLGIMAGFLNLIPEVGPLVAAVLATAVAFLEGSSFLHITNPWFAALTLGVYLVINNFKTIYLQPRILGKSVLLHEGVVFVAIIAAIVLQGILGVLIVVPLLASLMVLGRYIRRRLLGLPPFDDSTPSQTA